MCFSATAGFAAATYLAFAGTLCLKKNTIRSAYPFAAIPFLFAIQQLSEGILWLGFTYNILSIQTIMPYIFLFFALFLWPIWVPVSLMLIEPHATRRHYLVVLLMVGVIIALYLYHFLLWYGTVGHPFNCHIHYDISIPEAEAAIDTVAYLLATIAPFFVTSFPVMWLFGAGISIAYIITYLFYVTHLISLWCFFAALLSSFIYPIILKMNRYEKK